MKEVLAYWRKYEKVEKEARKKAEKEAQEQQKLYDEMREVMLSFKLSTTLLNHAFFIGKKATEKIEFFDHTDGVVCSFHV